MGTRPRWGSLTDTGRVRRVNEDAYLAEPPVFIVADGMGGHAAGEVASAIAMEKFRPLLGQTFLEIPSVLAALQEINDAILHAIEEDVAKDGMGTTITGLVLVQISGLDHWMIINIGDSRVYHIAGRQLNQITTDHSEVQELVAAGRLSAQEALVYPYRNVITRALGSLPAPQADTLVLPCTDGDRFIICSDGLTNEVSDDEILSISDSHDDPQDLAIALVAAANTAGGRDNITVVVVDAVIDPVEGAFGNTRPRKNP